MNQSLTRLCAVAVAVGISLMTSNTTALAHDVHHYPNLTLALGWLHEPAYVGFDNAVQVIVRDLRGNAIASIADSDLTVDIILGTQTLNGVKLVPTADPDTGLGIPGEYEAHLIPTAPGNYTFHVHGAVTGQAVEETVSTGPATFAEVQDESKAEFPSQVPPAADVAAKADQVGRRAESALALAAAAQTSADSGRALGIVGMVAGGLALVIVLIGYAIARRRRAA